MDIQFYGANCIALTVGGARVVIDDTLADMGGKPVAKSGDIVVYSHAHGNAPDSSKLVIDRPGEYEVSDISIYGIQARAHIDEAKQQSSIMYKFVAKDIRLLVTGHIFPKLKESELETIGTVDVMIVPVGGNGYTLDPVGVLELIKEIEPKLVIPTFIADDSLHFPVPARTLDEALQELGMVPKERTAKLKLRAGDFDDSSLQLVIVERS